MKKGIKVTSLKNEVESKDRKTFKVIDHFIKCIDRESENRVDDFIDIFDSNPYFIYSELAEMYQECEICILSELQGYNNFYDRKNYLTILFKRIDGIPTTENVDLDDAIKYLAPYNLSFEELMQSTDKKINIVYEISLSSSKIEIYYTEIEEQNRLFVQKATFNRLVLAHFKHKLLDFIKIKLDIIDKSNHRLANEKKKTCIKLIKGSTENEEFSYFHNSLKLQGFIEANLSNFRKAFNGEKGYIQIKWLKDQNELEYLISKLIETDKIKNYGAWIHTINMFILKDGTPIHKDIRTNHFKGVHIVLDKAIVNLI